MSIFFELKDSYGLVTLHCVKLSLLKKVGVYENRGGPQTHVNFRSMSIYQSVTAHGF